jgi:cleavage stimulation factor subunit 1
MVDSASLYRLVVAQLADDGYSDAAAAVATATNTPQLPGGSSSALPQHALLQLLNGQQMDALGPGGAMARASQPEIYRTRCAEDVGSLRAHLRFSPDGRQLAVGTAEGTVHVLDAAALFHGKGSAESALRKYTGHTGSVNDLDYHPNGAVLVSASEDANLNFYDLAGGNAQGPARMCTDTHPIRSAAFHPMGNHLLVGTSHAALRLYDVATFRCFLSPDAASHHQAGTITEARWVPDGSLFASCAGSEVKVWDGGSCRCLYTMSRPHGGTPVGGLQFSKSGRYLLTCGADSAVKLWDIRQVMSDASEGPSGGRGGPRPLRVFEGASQSQARRTATFSHDEALVLAADEASGSIITWSAITAEVTGRCQGHSRPVHRLVHAPNLGGFVSTGEDGALRAWAT